MIKGTERNMSINHQFAYVELLQQKNVTLAGFGGFILYPGMEFRSEIKWWPDKGIRPTLHEGVDFCYYQDSAGVEQYVDPNFKVPVMANGKVFNICDDYLGQTVFLDHGYDHLLRFLSIYAHITPCKELCIGDSLCEGEEIATIADTTGRKNRMPAHLHLSFMQANRDLPLEVFNWELICHGNGANLLDPLHLIHKDQIGFRHRNHWKEAFLF